MHEAPVEFACENQRVWTVPASLLNLLASLLNLDEHLVHCKPEGDRCKETPALGDTGPRHPRTPSGWTGRVLAR